MVKVCPKCDAKSVVKNGVKRGKQAYKCTSCLHRFSSKSREWSKVNTVKDLRKEYVWWKQTYQQLWDKIWKSKRTVQRMFDKYIEWSDEMYNDSITKVPTTIVADCTWCGDMWIIVFKSYQQRKVIYARVFEWEENKELYVSWIDYLRAKGWIIRSIVCDWLCGLEQAMTWLNFQTCQFHQLKNVIKYLTRKPKVEANRELLQIAYTIKDSSEIDFRLRLTIWHNKRKDMINQKTQSETNPKSRRYTHKKLRSAYTSIKRNLHILFTYTYHWDAIPNTTNCLEWYFKLLKAKTDIHNGMTLERKKKLVLWLLAI
jgi:transposase-like protein